MWLILLLHLVNSFKGLSGSERETLCASKACYTLHMERLDFEKAQQNCSDNGGYLMTQRDKQEEGTLLSLFSQIQRQDQDKTLKFWIGLKLHRQECVLPHLALRGFKWASGEKDSKYSNWKKEPVPTCTAERCARVEYGSSSQTELKWIAGSCRNPSFYACKFYFKGMCRPLALLGPGDIMYTAPFSKEPEKSQLKSFPVGTYANILCSDQQSHFSVCRASGDTYSWTDPGPFCKTGGQSCEIANGGCEHFCHQEEEDVRCSCEEGFDLEPDGLSCRMKDLCLPDTCDHQCVTLDFGFYCQCRDGFILSENQRDCSDIDECQSEATCEGHVCTNTHGGYTCTCKDGYEMVNSRCLDVDECARSRCEQRCSNSVGSFSCSCDEGFVLSKDGRSCVDINECAANRCYAEFECVNTVGSFTCANRHGFHLESSRPTQAPPITVTSVSALDDMAGQEIVTEPSPTGTAIDFQHPPAHTDPPLPEQVNATHGDRQSNSSLPTSLAQTVKSRLIICILGSVIPLVFVIGVTLFIIIFRCSRAKKEEKKNATTDGYCWVSSGLDPRLEKLYESILTDDL